MWSEHHDLCAPPKCAPPKPPPRKADALNVEPAMAIAAATKPIVIFGGAHFGGAHFGRGGFGPAGSPAAAGDRSSDGGSVVAPSRSTAASADRSSDAGSVVGRSRSTAASGDRSSDAGSVVEPSRSTVTKRKRATRKPPFLLADDRPRPDRARPQSLRSSLSSGSLLRIQKEDATVRSV